LFIAASGTLTWASCHQTGAPVIGAGINQVRQPACKRSGQNDNSQPDG